ncbi:RNA polymerase sigma factor [Aliiroseovarius marinus]|uniref:RNA polymerase sigma factor n=1 Tax=Aliiroseovarius marinus TaxID=2500159 RepID=UPI00105CDDAD|nr:sigma-70 family RNA polymerase sigma factor [Aliiroseovarius marinus]
MKDAELKSLIHRIGKGDKTALDALYRQMERPLYRFINIKLNDPYLSADILQEVFLDVWKGAAAFEGRSAVKTWMFSIAYRKVIDVFRKNARLTITDDLPEQLDEAPSAVAQISAVQEAEHLRACLAQLKPDHRDAIELAFYEDMGYREIAEVTSAPEGTVKTRIFHAKKLLLHCLQGRMNAKVAS